MLAVPGVVTSVLSQRGCRGTRCHAFPENLETAPETFAADEVSPKLEVRAHQHKTAYYALTEKRRDPPAITKTRIMLLTLGRRRKTAPFASLTDVCEAHSRVCMAR